MKVFEKRFKYFRGYSSEYSFSISSKNPVATAMGKLGFLAFILMVGWVVFSVLSNTATSLWPLIYIPIGFIALMIWGVFSIKFADRFFPRLSETPYKEDHNNGKV